MHCVLYKLNDQHHIEKYTLLVGGSSSPHYYVVNACSVLSPSQSFTSLPRSATIPALKVGDLPLPLHLVHADLTCHQNENKHV